MDESDGNESDKISTESSKPQKTRNSRSGKTFQKDVANFYDGLGKKNLVHYYCVYFDQDHC